MKWETMLALFVLAFMGLCESAVVNLTDDNFDEMIQKNNVIMVKFFAPWCGHCKHLAPIYEKIAEKAKEEGKPFVFAELDATVHSKSAEKYGVSGYPTIKLFIDGNAIDYDGERSEKDILAFVVKRSSPPTRDLKSVEDIQEIISRKGRRVRKI